MNNTEISSSKSRLALPRLLPQRNSFTAEEVRQRLRLNCPGDARTAAVHTAAAMTAIWSSLLPDRQAFDLGRTATRLPTVVYWYSQGVPMPEIGRRLSPFGGAWDADRALDVAAALIAHAMNRGYIAEVAA